jgi:hypothetical protein
LDKYFWSHAPWIACVTLFTAEERYCLLITTILITRVPPQQVIKKDLHMLFIFTTIDAIISLQFLLRRKLCFIVSIVNGDPKLLHTNNRLQFAYFCFRYFCCLWRLFLAIPKRYIFPFLSKMNQNYAINISIVSLSLDWRFSYYFVFYYMHPIVTKIGIENSLCQTINHIVFFFSCDTKLCNLIKAIIPLIYRWRVLPILRHNHHSIY